MPIYAYKCDTCGFAKDVLQKLSDAPLTDCPSCHAAAFKKQLTAAGFQLKGSGWYVTDFKDGNTGKPATTDDKPPGGGEAAESKVPAAAADGGATKKTEVAAAVAPAKPATPAASGSDS